MPGEVAEAGSAVAQPSTLEYRHDEIAHGRHGLRGHSTPNAAGVFAEGHISHVVQLVFDGPMPATEAEQVRGTGSLRRQARDFEVHLRVPAPLASALVHESADLPERLACPGRSRKERCNASSSADWLSLTSSR